MSPLILASGSPYRRNLLARLVESFEIVAPEVDESTALAESPAEAVTRIARAKAAAVAKGRPDAVVLAGDQLASVGEGALGKPAGTAQARQMLATLSGRVVTYFTAIALLGPGLDDPICHLDRSRVILRRLTKQEIERYLEHERPFDCAGALKLETSGIALCEGIESSDPTALIGLPLIETARLLRNRGYSIP